MKIIVLDAEQRAALAVIRSLVARGTDVVAASSVSSAIGSYSKGVASSFVYPDPRKFPEAFLDALASQVKLLAAAVVVPVTDLTTMLLADAPPGMVAAKMTCASRDSYELLTDKERLVDLAVRLGIPVPRTINARTADEILSACKEIGFPAVLKPYRSQYLQDGGIVSSKVLIFNSSEDLTTRINQLPGLGHITYLVQEFVVGHGAGVFTVSSTHGPLAWFAHRRLREKPPSGGVSVLCESAPVNAKLREYAERLLEAADWIGPAMVEFRIANDGSPYLMEVNGRFWGSLQLSIDCGIDFPWLAVEAAFSCPEIAALNYPLGQRLRWFLGDVDNLLLQVRDGRLATKEKIKVLAQFAASCFDRQCRNEVFRLADPMPGVREAANWITSLCGHRRS